MGIWFGYSEVDDVDALHAEIHRARRQMAHRIAFGQESG